MQVQVSNTIITDTIKKPSLIKMVWNPIEQMRNIRNSPIIIFALLTVTLFYTIGAATMAFNYDVNSFMKDIPDAENNTILFKSIVVGFAAFSGLTTPLFNILLTSIFFYVIAKFVKSSVTFRQIFSMNTYVMIVGVIGLLFNSFAVHLFNLDGIQTVTSLSSLIDSKLFTKMEIFTIWQTILTGIGLYYVANFSRMLCWIISLILLFAIICSGFLFSSMNLLG